VTFSQLACFTIEGMIRAWVRHAGRVSVTHQASFPCLWSGHEVVAVANASIHVDSWSSIPQGGLPNRAAVSGPRNRRLVTTRFDGPPINPSHIAEHCFKCWRNHALRSEIRLTPVDLGDQLDQRSHFAIRRLQLIGMVVAGPAQTIPGDLRHLAGLGFVVAQ